MPVLAQLIQPPKKYIHKVKWGSGCVTSTKPVIMLIITSETVSGSICFRVLHLVKFYVYKRDSLSIFFYIPLIVKIQFL